MKKLLILSLLVLFGCSKDSEEEASVAPGDEIIGTHQIIDKPDEGWKSKINLDRMVTNGIITFTDNYKGFYEIESEDGWISKKNFDWSFDGARWDLLEEGGGVRWSISFFDFYTMAPHQENQAYISRHAIFYFE